MGDNKRWSAADVAAVAWVALHFYTGVHAFLYGLHRTYTSWTWVLLGIWLLGLLALDIWLYASGGAELLRSLKWLWGFSAGMYGVMVLGGLLDWTIPDMVALVFVICAFVTPLFQQEALFWLFRETVGLKPGAFIGFLFCLLHFVFIAWLHRRAKQRGETDHGPVDPGAGILESEL